MSKAPIFLAVTTVAASIFSSFSWGDYLTGDNLRRAISGATIKAKTAKDGDDWELRFGRTKDVEFRLADGTRRRATWRVNGKRIEFAFSSSGDETCRMIYVAPDGKQHWQDCETAKTSSYVTQPVFASTKPASQPIEQDVTKALGVETEELKTRQFAIWGQAQTAVVASKNDLRRKVKLDADHTYVVVAACAGDCTHVRLTLRGPDGSQLIESPEQHSVVIVSGKVDSSGDHEIQVTVPGCKSESCPVGFQVLRQ